MLKIGDAAKLLGITKDTLKYWMSVGGVKYTWHPVCKYRMISEEEILLIKSKLQSPTNPR